MEYVAGFLDGEGTVSLARIPRPPSYEYCVRISIYNTDRPILVEIRKAWGGILTSVAARNPRWKPSYALIWTNAAAARFLSRVASHLRIKSNQAKALDEFLRHRQKCRRRRNQNGRLLPLLAPELEVREALYRRVKELNKRGSTTSPKRQRVSVRGRISRIISPEYLAGFIDAEGCLMIAKSDQVERWNPQYGARVCVGNTNRAILEEIQRIYGGILANQPARTVGWKDAYQLIWTGRRVERLLRAVRPHLRVKRVHATILLQLTDHRKKTRQGRVRRGFAPLPNRVIAYREGLYRRIRKLNAKGPLSS